MNKCKKPNVIFIFTDQQRADTIGFKVNGNKVSPNLERIAAEGAIFKQAFTPQPVCGPARACVQTGVYGTENGVYRNGLGLDAQKQNVGNTIATWFQNGGYEIGYIGKWHLASNSGPTDFDAGKSVRFHNVSIPEERRGGYNEYWLGVQALEHSSHGYNGMEDLSWNDGKNPKGFMFDADGNKVEFSGYRVDAQTDFILDYIDGRSEDKPWFLFTSFIEPHHQNDHARYEGPKESKEMFSIDQSEVPKDLWGASWLNKGDWKENFPDYLGQCWSLDKNMARIEEKLKQRGMWENTLFIFTSDHGSHFRTREGEYKRNPTDGCTHIPMIVRGPGFRGGKEVDELVSLIDLVPTMLQAANLPIPEHLRGRPMQDLMLEETPEDWKDFVFTQISETQVGRCVRTKKWKLSVRAPGLNGRGFSKSPIYMEDFLFNLEEDPNELNNLVEQPGLEKVKERLKGMLISKMREIGEQEPVIVPHLSIPKPAILEETGRIIIKENNQTLLKLGVGDGSRMMEMDIPLAEIVEEIINAPIILNLNEKQYTGTIKRVDNGENKLQFVDSEGTERYIADLFKNGKDMMHSFSVFYPTEQDKELKQFEPEYHAFVYAWKD